jgi:multidrug resistance efflux pump
MQFKNISTFPLLAVLLIALAFALTGCGRSKAQSSKTQAPTAQSVAIDVSVAPAVLRQLPRYFEASGSFAGDEQTDVAPAVGGKVVSVNVDLGSYVQRGQLLVLLDDRDARIRLEQAQAQVQQQEATVRQAEAKIGIKPGQAFDPERVADVGAARAAYVLAEKQLQRQERLIESGDVSRSSFDERRAQRDQLQQQYEVTVQQARQNYAAIQTARAGVDAARTQIQQAQKAITDARIAAPISGFVVDRPADLGEYVTTSTKIATIVRTNPLRVRIDIPEQAVGQIRTGLSVAVTTSAYPDRSFSGRIARISPNVTSASRTMTVEAEVENPTNELKPGQFATIRIASSLSRMDMRNSDWFSSGRPKEI